jgi:hypothetical protein
LNTGAGIYDELQGMENLRVARGLAVVCGVAARCFNALPHAGIASSNDRHARRIMEARRISKTMIALVLQWGDLLLIAVGLACCGVIALRFG